MSFSLSAFFFASSAPPGCEGERTQHSSCCAALRLANLWARPDLRAGEGMWRLGRKECLCQGGAGCRKQDKPSAAHKRPLPWPSTWSSTNSEMQRGFLLEDRQRQGTRVRYHSGSTGQGQGDRALGGDRVQEGPAGQPHRSPGGQGGEGVLRIAPL